MIAAKALLSRIVDIELEGSWGSSSSPEYSVGKTPMATLGREVHSSTDISLQRLNLSCVYSVRESEPPRIREGPSSSMPSSVSLLLLPSSSSSLDSILPISSLGMSRLI